MSWSNMHKWVIRNADDINVNKNELKTHLSKKPVLITETEVSVIHFAALGKSSTVLDYLLKRLPNFHTRLQNLNGETPLHWAARSGNVRNVSSLINKHANPNILDYDGNSVLHFAIEVGDYEIVKFLVDCGVCLESRNKYGDSPLSVAFRENFEKITKLLLANGVEKY